MHRRREARRYPLAMMFIIFNLGCVLLPARAAAARRIVTIALAGGALSMLLEASFAHAWERRVREWV